MQNLSSSFAHQFSTIICLFPTTLSVSVYECVVLRLQFRTEITKFTFKAKNFHIRIPKLEVQRKWNYVRRDVVKDRSKRLISNFKEHLVTKWNLSLYFLSFLPLCFSTSHLWDAKMKKGIHSARGFQLWVLCFGKHQVEAR